MTPTHTHIMWVCEGCRGGGHRRPSRVNRSKTQHTHKQIKRRQREEQRWGSRGMGVRGSAHKDRHKRHTHNTQHTKPHHNHTKNTNYQRIACATLTAKGGRVNGGRGGGGRGGNRGGWRVGSDTHKTHTDITT